MAPVIAGLALALLTRPGVSAGDEPVARFVGPTSSQPLALTADNAFLIVANPDNNSVTFFDLRADRNRRLATGAGADRAQWCSVPAEREQRPTSPTP
jgi:hypothetical protein